MEYMNGDAELDVNEYDIDDSIVASLLTSLIQGEWENIQKYKDMITSIETSTSEKSYDSVTEVLDDILEGKHFHLGALQGILKDVAPEAALVDAGEEEIEKRLENIDEARVVTTRKALSETINKMVDRKMRILEYRQKRAIRNATLLEGLGDGWSDEICRVTEPVLHKLDVLAYEIRNCVRGAYTGARTVEELADYVDSLVGELSDVADRIRDAGDDE